MSGKEGKDEADNNKLKDQPKNDPKIKFLYDALRADFRKLLRAEMDDLYARINEVEEKKQVKSSHGSVIRTLTDP